MVFLLAALHFVTLFTAALVAGGQVLVLMVIVPVKRRLADPISVEVHNAMLGHQTDRYMKPAGIISFVSAIAILCLGALGYATLSPVVVGGLVCGLLGMVGVVITSHFFNVRTNAMLLKWERGTVPPNYDAIRRRWDLVHTVRTSCGLFALAGDLVAALAMNFVS
jgi:hypothetical protein